MKFIPANASKKTGFTLIEIIVSLALFSVVITIAVGALLILIASNRQLQNEQSVLSNLSFALDSMTREIRTGSHYYCDAGASSGGGTGSLRLFNTSNLTEGQVQNCSTADGSGTPPQAFHGISFDEGGDSITSGNASRRIAYFFARDEGKLYRRLSGEAAESIVSDGIYINEADFYVTGSGIGSTDNTQPKITIVLEAYNSEEAADSDATGERAYVIQTTVTQRSLDI